MFDAYCSGCDAVVLLGPQRIVSLENADHGIVLTFRCYCGTQGVLVGRRTGGTVEQRSDELLTL